MEKTTGQPPKNNLIVATDVGSGFTKAATSDGTRVSLPSYVTPMPEGLEDGFGGQNQLGVVTYAGKTWITGEEAALVSATLADTRNDNWPRTEAWLALLMRAIYEAGVRNGDVIDLVVGVPQSSWSIELRDELVSTLARRHKVTVNGDNIEFEIRKRDSMVMPQAYAGMTWIIDNDPAISDAVDSHMMVAGIDLGTYTTGYVVFQNGKYSHRLSGGVHGVGIWKVAQSLQKMLTAQYQYSPSIDTVISLMRVPTKVRIKGDTHDIRPLIRRAVEGVFPPLGSTLVSTWGNDAEGMDIVVFGGGAEIFLPSIVERFPRARIVDSPEVHGRFIPVIGMMNYFATINDLV